MTTVLLFCCSSRPRAARDTVAIDMLTGRLALSIAIIQRVKTLLLLDVCDFVAPCAAKAVDGRAAVLASFHELLFRHGGCYDHSCGAVRDRRQDQRPSPRSEHEGRAYLQPDRRADSTMRGDRESGGGRTSPTTLNSSGLARPSASVCASLSSQFSFVEPHGRPHGAALGTGFRGALLAHVKNSFSSARASSISPSSRPIEYTSS